MNKIITQIIITIITIITIQLFLPYAWAQNPLFNNSSGMLLQDRGGISFRDSNSADSALNNLGMGESLSSKMRMMANSSISGLLYQVHVLGEVKHPGTYRVTASDRVYEVLQKAGGVLASGSNRLVEIRSKKNKINYVDLHLFLVNGKLSQNPYILDNDVIFVPLKQRSVRIVGAVKRPNEYEIGKEKTLADMVHLAGDFSVGVNRDDTIRVVRFENGQKQIINVKLDNRSLQKFSIQNGDVVYVPHVITKHNEFDYDVPKLAGDNIFYPSFENRVFILGGVQRPGAVNFNPYFTIDQYISLSGGTSKLAKKKVYVITSSGKKTKLKMSNTKNYIVNPGDTIIIDESRIPPEGYMSMFMSIASFGLSTTSTILALTK